MPTVPQLVTFQQVKDHIRVDHDEDDDKISLLVIQASAIVLNYIYQFPREDYQSLPVYDTDTPPVMIQPWPWAWPVSAHAPYWWPATRVVYQQLPPYVADTWDLAGSPVGVVPGNISAAALLIAGALYRDREGGDPISPAVRALLMPYGDPAIA